MLNKEEYIENVLEIAEIEQQSREIYTKIHSSELDRMYEVYIKTNGKNINLKKCNDTKSISHIDVFTETNVKDASFISNWIILPDLQKVLIKKILTDKYNAKERFYSLCNHLVCPEISRELGMESAMYFVSQNKDDICILTPSFLAKDEKLVSGREINRRVFKPTSIESDMENLENVINLNNGSNNDVEESKRNYIKQKIFWYIIDNKDQADRNWGEIVSNNGCKFAPNFDYDFCFGEEDFGPRNFKVKDTDIENLINKYKNQPWFSEWIKSKVIGFSTESIFKKAEECIPEKHLGKLEGYKAGVKNTIDKKISNIKDIFMPISIEF